MGAVGRKSEREASPSESGLKERKPSLSSPQVKEAWAGEEVHSVGVAKGGWWGWRLEGGCYWGLASVGEVRWV